MTVKVKPLVWDECGVSGEYNAYKTASGKWRWYLRDIGFLTEIHPTEEAAKAAAQADYDARILAALEPDQAALTAIERAAYERGVRDAAAVSKGRGFSDGSSPPDHPYDRGYQRGVDDCTKHILALLKQEGR